MDGEQPLQTDQQTQPLQPEPVFEQQEEQAPQTHIEPIVWSASEYISHEKSTRWYAILLGGSVALVLLVFFVTKDILATLVVLLACSAIGILGGRKPASRQYMITEDGVRVDEKFYPFATFKSYSVVDEGPIDSIWLKPHQRFAPNVVMYFPPEDEDMLASTIGDFLPYEQLELDSVDRLSKRMRF